MDARLVELGFGGDLQGFLRDRYNEQLHPVLKIAGELGVGNERIQTLLDQAGIVRRRPGGAWAARGLTVAQERGRAND